MSAISFGKRILNGTSALALSSIALLGVQPAAATTVGIFGGGSTLASLDLRQEFDSWLGTSSTLGLYAGVGSGNGLRAFTANRADQLFRGNVSTPFPSTVLLPAVPPTYLSTNGSDPSYLTTYPYPHIDFGASDSPLPINFLASVPTLTTISSTLTTTFSTTTYTIDWSSNPPTATAPTASVSYNATNWGAPIQLPLFEAPVAVAVDLPAVDPTTAQATVGGTTWTIKSQFSTSAAGGRIQLSTAQICAIFSGLVTDWNSTASIPYIDRYGNPGVQNFSDDNTYHATSSAGTPGTGATAYTSSSKPITIVYRSDGSGTSFIFTNYLKTVCPLLDPSNTYGYQSIYNTSVLPNNNFTQLINKVTAYGRSFAATVGADGSDAVAAAIGNSSANYGYIGYLSNDFVQPYNPVSSTAPYGASLQNDYLRLHQVYHPGQSGDLGSAQNFIAPTPTSADAAWAALPTPSTTWTFNDYNVYAKTFPATTYLPGSDPVPPSPARVDISGKSILPLAGGAGAYSLVGTAYGFFYSCYGDTTSPYSITGLNRSANIKNFLVWHYDLLSGNHDAKNILEARGFHEVPASWTSSINAEYLNGANPSVIAYPGAPFTNCYTVTGGAQG